MNPIQPMNPKKPFGSGLSRFFLNAVCACFLTAIPANAQITVVNTGSATRTSSASGQSFNINFDAGATADAILVSLSSESNATAGQVAISYAGLAFTPVIDHSANRPSIWLLNLSNTTYTGGTATLVLNLTGVTTANGYGLGIVSVNTGNALLNELAVHASNTSTTQTVGLTTTLESFVIAGHRNNLTSGTYAPIAPMTQIYRGAIGSSMGAAGYQTSVAAGSPSFSFTNSDNGESSAAAAFVPVNLVPTLKTRVPADNAINVPMGSNLVATFSEPVVAGTGDIELWVAGGGSAVETFGVSPLSPRLTFSGNTLTIDPASNLTSGVEYYVLIPATAVLDTGGAAFAGILDSTAWSFTADGTSPTLVSRNPADNTPSFPVASNLVAIFSEAVLAGTGNVELWQVGGDSPLESFNVSPLSPRLTLSGSTLTIDPTADFTPGVEYYILIDSTAFVDTSNLSFAGISDPTAWSFTADNTGAIFDDFNDGNDDGWTRLSPLTLAGAPAVYSFPGGNSYQISSPVSPNPGLVGPARAGSLRLDQSYADYFQQSVDIVNWDNTQSGLTIGMLARVSQPGLGTTDGYSLTVTLGGMLEIFRITDEQPVSSVSTASIGALNPANDYRLVFTGDGSTLTGQIFNLADLSTPLATISGSDATYASGNSGLIVSSSSDTQTATATFDNYASATFGTPLAKANNPTNLDSGTSWVGGVVPTFADRAKWDSTVTSANTTSLGADLTWGGIVITGPTGPVTIDPGNTLSLGAGLVDIDLSNAEQDLTLNCNLAMQDPNVWDVTSGRTLAVGGVVSGSAGVTKLGAGTAVLSNVNTYTGGTTISAGTLELSGTGTPGAAGSNVAVSSGALLDLNGTNQNIGFTAGTGVGTVANNSGSGTSTLTMSANPSANVIIQDFTTTPGGKVAVVVAAISSGMNAANTYSGGTTVNAGAYLYATTSDSQAGTGPINLTAGTGSTATSSGLLVNGITVANDITGAGYVHINANPGTAVFTGTLNTSGTFNFRSAASFFNFAGSGNSTLSGVIGPAGGSGVHGPNITVSTGSVIKSGTGTLTLSGNNLYTGSTTVSGGTLVLLGGSQRSPITVQDGATLGFDIAAPTTSTNSVTLNAGHKIRVNGSPTLPSYTLLTTSATIIGAEPNLDPAIPGYDVIVDGTNTLKLVAASTNTFASWISDPAFGLAEADQDLGDDPDGDGIDNGVENFFGTNPGTFSQGLLVGIKSGNTFTFTHPQNATPASDLTASYSWSKDLATFLANGATDGAFTKVDFTTQPDTPSPGITTVTATVTGAAASKLFVRVNVSQP